MKLTASIRFRMTQEDRDELEKIADRDGTQVASVIRRAILEYLRKENGKSSK